MENVSELARSAQQGNLEAFASLVKQFQDMAFTVAYARLGDEALAEDAAQESFIEAYLGIGSLREPAAFAGWLRRIVQRRCNRIVRRQVPQPYSLELAAGLPARDPDPAGLLIDRETREALRRAVDSLPEHEQTAFLLHYVSGFSQNEIAEFLEVPGATLRKRLQSARNRLKEKIMTMGEDYFERKPSKGDDFGRTVRFFIAVRTGDVNEAGRLLSEDPCLAVARERLSETLAGLYPRAQPTRKDRNALGEREREGWTPLYWSVWAGNVPMSRLLIEHGAQPDAAAWRDVPPVTVAARAGHREAVVLLLESGIDPDSPGAPSGPLHAAVSTQRTEIVRLLLDRGADIERRDRFGRTPLHWAVTCGHPDMAALLLECGAHREPVDARGYTPLWWARHGAHDAVVRLLLEGGANV